MYFTSGCIVQSLCGMLSVGLCRCIDDASLGHMIVQTGDRSEFYCRIKNGLHAWQVNGQRPPAEYHPNSSNSNQNYTLSLFFPRNGEEVVKCVCKPNGQDLEECSATTKVIVLGVYLHLCTIMESEWST